MHTQLTADARILPAVSCFALALMLHAPSDLLHLIQLFQGY